MHLLQKKKLLVIFHTIWFHKRNAGNIPGNVAKKVQNITTGKPVVHEQHLHIQT